jgi:hypothetical protein
LRQSLALHKESVTDLFGFSANSASSLRLGGKPTYYLTPRRNDTAEFAEETELVNNCLFVQGVSRTKPCRPKVGVIVCLPHDIHQQRTF